MCESVVLVARAGHLEETDTYRLGGTLQLIGGPGQRQDTFVERFDILAKHLRRGALRVDGDENRLYLHCHCAELRQRFGDLAQGRWALIGAVGVAEEHEEPAPAEIFCADELTVAIDKRERELAAKGWRRLFGTTQPRPPSHAERAHAYAEQNLATAHSGAASVLREIALCFRDFRATAVGADCEPGQRPIIALRSLHRAVGTRRRGGPSNSPEPAGHRFVRGLEFGKRSMIFLRRYRSGFKRHSGNRNRTLIAIRADTRRSVRGDGGCRPFSASTWRRRRWSGWRGISRSLSRPWFSGDE